MLLNLVTALSLKHIHRIYRKVHFMQFYGLWYSGNPGLRSTDVVQCNLGICFHLVVKAILAAQQIIIFWISKRDNDQLNESFMFIKHKYGHVFNHISPNLFHCNMPCVSSFASVPGWNRIGTIIRRLFPQVQADELLNEQIKMATQEESVREFVAVTDVDEERARFFLESAGWDLQVHLFWSFLLCDGAADGKSQDQHQRHDMCQTNSLPANVSPCCRQIVQVTLWQ